MKLNGEGQAAIMTTEQIEKILRVADPVSAMILQILRYTGERPRAVLNLAQYNCYHNPNIAKDTIVFPAITRKKAAGKKAKERLVHVVPALKKALEKYEAPPSFYMFPSPRDLTKPIGYHCFRLRFEGFLKQAKLNTYNFTLYSYRRTFVTTIAKQGLTLSELMNATGHQSTSSVTRYIEVDENAIERAMMFLK